MSYWANTVVTLVLMAYFIGLGLAVWVGRREMVVRYHKWLWRRSRWLVGAPLSWLGEKVEGKNRRRRR
jgi:uncharacterized membrane protein